MKFRAKATIHGRFFPVLCSTILVFFTVGGIGCGPFPHAKWFVPVTVQTPHHCTQITALLASPKILNQKRRNLCSVPPPDRTIILLYYPDGYQSCKAWRRLSSGVLVPTKIGHEQPMEFESTLLARNGQQTMAIPILAMHYGDIFCAPLKSTPSLHRPWHDWPITQPLARSGYQFNYIRLEFSTAALKSIQTEQDLRLKFCWLGEKDCSVTRLFVNSHHSDY